MPDDTTKLYVRNELDASEKEAQRKFAAKWVERVVWGVGSVVGTGVLLGILKVIGLGIGISL